MEESPIDELLAEDEFLTDIPSQEDELSVNDTIQ